MPLFLAPIYLIAAAAAALPLILHLMHRRRPRLVPFSTLRFLQQAIARTRRSRRICNFLILLLRTLIILLLVFAFARPTIQYAGSLGSERRTLLLIMDTAAAMRMREDTSLFERGREWALQLVDSLQPGDRVGIVAAGLAPSPHLLMPPIADHRQVRQALLEIEPGYGSSVIATATRDGLERLRFGRDLTGLEVHVFSDFRDHAWNQHLLAGMTGQLGENTVFFLNRIRPEVEANAGIVSAKFSPPAMIGESTSVLRVDALLRSGRDFSGSVQARLKLDGEEAHSTTLNLGPESEMVAGLLGTPGQGATGLTGELRIDSDIFSEDNAFFFSLPRVDRVDLLIIDNGNTSQAGSFFLRKAVAPTGPDASLYSVRLVEARAFAAGEPGTSGDIVLVNGHDSLPETAVSRLRQLAQAGATIVVLPAGDDQSGDFFAGFDDWPELQVEYLDYGRTEQEQLLFEGGAGAFRLEDRIRQALPFTIRVPVSRRFHFSQLPTGSTRLLSYGDSSPFLWTVPVGEGRLWVGSVGVDRQWSDWVLSPLFVVAVREIVKAGAQQRQADLTTRVGGTVSLPWPGDELVLTGQVTGPDGLGSSVELRRQTAIEPFALNGFRQVGFYRFSLAERNLTVAVNLPESELEFNYPGVAELAAGLPGVRVESAADWPELQRSIALIEHGLALWPWLLLIAFALALLEEILAGWLSRARKSGKPVGQVLAGV